MAAIVSDGFLNNFSMETIVVADDQEIIRLGIRAIIDKQPKQYNVIEAVSCAEVMQILATNSVQFIILDMFLAGDNIFSTAYRLLENGQDARILVHSMKEDLYALRLMQKGIRGFVTKRGPVKELENAIGCLLKGEIYMSAAMKEDLFKPDRVNLFGNPVDALSDRELEVAEYVANGLGPTEIAKKMKLDVTTVSTYRRRAFEKLSVHNTMELKEKFTMYKR
jgi:two-component system, NarL family, invasion response regulator UvrY